MASCGYALLQVTHVILLILPLSFSHYLPEPASIIRGVLSDGKHFLTRRSTGQSLRIKVFTQSPSIQKLSADAKELITGRLLPDATSYFSKTLRVRQTVSPIRLQRRCDRELTKNIKGLVFRFCSGFCKNTTYCGTVPVPEEHLDVCRTCASNETRCQKTRKEISNSIGVRDADFVLYISALSTSHCKQQDDTLAYAAVCQLEQKLDRPVAGFVNFCVEKLVKNIHYSHWLAFLKHEIFHALGFSSSMYGYYRGDDGRPLTMRLSDGRPVSKWSDKVVKEIIRSNWKVSDTAGSSVIHKVQMIVLPRVVEEVQSHFNCPSLEGAEIEDQGELGRRYTHWEKRVFENEAMTGVFTNSAVFSRVTLALMEDTGWYRANYAMAEKLVWGRKAGCLFVQNSCKAWIDNQKGSNKPILPYCTEVEPSDHSHTGCTIDYHGVGACNLVKYNTPLSTAYQYFDSLPGVSSPSHYGGATVLADYCPYFQEIDWKKNGKSIRGSYCKHESNNPSSDLNYALEHYGSGSVCFLQGQAWTKKSNSRKVTAINWGSGCYSYTCTSNGLTLSIVGCSFLCSFAGQKLHLRIKHEKWLHKGTILCPPCHVFCNGSCPLVETSYLNVSGLSKEKLQQALVCNLASFGTGHSNLFIIMLILQVNLKVF